MSAFYLLLLCLAFTNARKLKDEVSNLLSSLDHEISKTKGVYLGDIDGVLPVEPELTVTLSDGHNWLDAVRHHIKHKVGKLHAALDEIEHAHNNLNSVPMSVENKNLTVLLKRQSPVSVPTEKLTFNPVPVTVNVESKVLNKDASKSGAKDGAVNSLCKVYPSLCEGDNDLGLLLRQKNLNILHTVPVTEPKTTVVSRDGLKLDGKNDLFNVNVLCKLNPHLCGDKNHLTSKIDGDIYFTGDDYINELTNLGQNIKLKLATPVQSFETRLEDLINDSEEKLSKLKALSKLRASKLVTNEKIENVLCKYNPALCEDESDLKLALQLKKPSVDVNVNSELAALLQSIQGNQQASQLELSRDGDNTQPLSRVYFSVPASQPVQTNPSVVVSRPVPVSQQVLYSQVDPSQYKVGVPVSVKLPVLQTAPVYQVDPAQYRVNVPADVKIPVLQAAPVSQVDPTQYAVGIPETVKIPVLQGVASDAPVSQNVPVSPPALVSPGASLQGSLGSSLEATVNNLESNKDQGISIGVPLQRNDGPAVLSEEVKPEGQVSRRFGDGRGRGPYNYGGRKNDERPAGVYYPRRPY